mgnify:CR=1 FL=1
MSRLRGKTVQKKGSKMGEREVPWIWVTEPGPNLDTDFRIRGLFGSGSGTNSSSRAVPETTRTQHSLLAWSWTGLIAILGQISGERPLRIISKVIDSNIHCKHNFEVTFFALKVANRSNRKDESPILFRYLKRALFQQSIMSVKFSLSEAIKFRV